MTEIEKILVKALADLGVHTTEVSKTQSKIANFMAQHLPDLSEDEKREILEAAEISWRQVQNLQEVANKLKALL